MVPVAGAGSKIVTSFRPLPFLPLRKRWIARVVEFEWNKYFADTQEQGPFKSFHHRHEVRSDLRDGKTGTLVKDVITYEIGFGLVDRVANVFIAAQLKKTFKYRQDALSQMLLPR
jgi:ligand-binding SRPBCC domain-containing protein